MNLSNKVSRLWSRYRKKREIRSYCRSQAGSASAGKHILLMLLFLVGSVGVLGQAATFGQAMPQLFLIIAAFMVSLRIMTAWEDRQLWQICQAKTCEKEFNKRLERIPSAEVLHYLGEKAAASFGIRELAAAEQGLEGIYRGEKLVISYHHLEEDEVMETQAMLALLRECRKKEIGQVRVFVNTNFSPKARVLGDRFGINLRTYDGLQLRRFLMDSPIYPTPYEVEALIKRESDKRRRRLTILRKEAVQANKFIAYLVYCAVLFAMAWFKIGFAYWNLGFGLLMLVLALLSLRQVWPKKEEDLGFD